MKYLLFAITLLLVAGCSTLFGLQGDAAGKIADGVNQYCDNTDQAFRDGLRADVKKALADKGRSVVVDCGTQ